MDFAQLKSKAKELQKKAQEISDGAVKFGAAKLASSGAVLKDMAAITKFIESSKQTSIKTDSGEEKIFTHRSLLLLTDPKGEFFESMLLSFPVLQTKAFSQNVNFKMANASIENLKMTDFKAESVPALVVYENEEIIKVIQGEEKIQSLVKSMSLDINTAIDEM